MKQNKLTLSILKGIFGIYRLETGSEIPAWMYGSSFISITRTPEELSVVCQESGIPANISANIPAGTQAERGWNCLKVEGPLDFGLTGILAGISKALDDNGVSIFAVSTYDTDYILVREKDLECACKALKEAGYDIKKS